MQLWEKSLNDTYEAYEKTQNDEFLQEFIMGSYGLIPYLIDNKELEKAENVLDKAQKSFKKLKNQEKYLSFYGAFLAFEIGIDFYKAVFLGPKIMDYIDKSLEGNPTNPYGWLEKGNAEFHMPRAFGGSYEEAIVNYSKAVKSFEAKNDTRYNWVYLNTLTFLAQSYIELEQYKEAKKVYEKILQISPDFQWVKNELYPALLELSETTKS